MSRLIDADALKKAIKTECNPYGKPTIDFESGKKVLKIIDHAPTVSFMISPDYVTELQNLNKELIKQIEELERPTGEWIPINSIEDIPKDRMLFVTLDNGYVETLYYDMTEWSDNEYARHAVAYMDYWEYQPMPYRGDL